MEGFMDNIIITKGVWPYDIFANLIIRHFLKKRGSKEIFSSAEKADEVLSGLNAEKQDAFRLMFRLKNEVHDETLNGFPLYVFSPKGGLRSEKKVIYLHGGAFVNQPDRRHFRLAGELSEKSGASLFFPVYPKAPGHQFKETYDLVEKLFLRLSEEVGAENVVFAGDSAGAMLCVTLCGFFREKGLPLPSKLVLFSPVAETALSNPEIARIYPRDPMQGTEGLKRYIEAWAGDEPIDSPLIDPMSADLSILPETLIFCGMNEIFNPDVCLFAEKAAAAGAKITCFRFRHLYHCFVLFDQLAAKRARKTTAKFISSSP